MAHQESVNKNGNVRNRPKTDHHGGTDERNPVRGRRRVTTTTAYSAQVQYGGRDRVRPAPGHPSSVQADVPGPGHEGGRDPGRFSWNHAVARAPACSRTALAPTYERRQRS
ncbi:hypothetical protein GCM10010245_78710 [Streptomyces spectabilis]|nr:hypothetical protein GCM10010245_78710 [Streptomyces spectabilis]